MNEMSVTPWLVRRKCGNAACGIYEVVSFDRNGFDPVVAKMFDNLAEAQQFAAEANRMIGRGYGRIKKS